MPLNPFFEKFHAKNEQDLYDDLVVEFIEINGMEIYYIPRNLVNFDQLYGTDDQSDYSTIIPTCVYMENIDGFQGQQNIFTKFTLEIRDSITVSMARKAFELEVQPTTNQPRPMEGDLIYFPMNKKVFQIKFTNNKEIFYPLGILPTYKLTCDLFEYSDETFATGIPDIDDIQNQASLNILDYVITTEDGRIITDEKNNMITTEAYDIVNIEPIDDNDILNKDEVGIIDFSEINPFGGITS
jgi:hypothetical protein